MPVNAGFDVLIDEGRIYKSAARYGITLLPRNPSYVQSAAVRFRHLTKYSAGHSAGQGSDRTHTRFEIVDPPLQFSDLNTDGAQVLRRICGWRS